MKQGALKVVLTPNYSLDETEAKCARGELPFHYLWGIDQLRARGIDTVSVPSPTLRSLKRVSQLLGFSLGDLEREYRLLAMSSPGDVVVAAEPGFARGLGLLHRSHLLRRRLITIFHPYEPRSLLSVAAARGSDVAVCLSSRIQGDLIGRVGRSRASTPLAHSGPDLRFPKYQPTGELHVVSTGRTHRDIDTLAAAAARINFETVIHTEIARTSQGPVRYAIARAYSEVLEDLRAAAIVAIPLRRNDGTFGLTELNDALALGKPVVMTRNDYIDADIEEIGCGRWVAPGDVEGWRMALQELLSDDQQRQDMGGRGRAFAERHWNYDRFGEVLADAVTASRAS